MQASCFAWDKTLAKRGSSGVHSVRQEMGSEAKFAAHAGVARSITPLITETENQISPDPSCHFLRSSCVSLVCKFGFECVAGKHEG